MVGEMDGHSSENDPVRFSHFPMSPWSPHATSIPNRITWANTNSITPWVTWAIQPKNQERNPKLPHVELQSPQFLFMFLFPFESKLKLEVIVAFLEQQLRLRPVANAEFTTRPTQLRKDQPSLSAWKSSEALGDWSGNQGDGDMMLCIYTIMYIWYALTCHVCLYIPDTFAYRITINICVTFLFVSFPFWIHICIYIYMYVGIHLSFYIYLKITLTLNNIEKLVNNYITLIIYNSKNYYALYSCHVV